LRAGHGAEIARAFEHHAFAKPAATGCSSSAGWWSRAGPPCSPRTCSSPRYTNDSASADCHGTTVTAWSAGRSCRPELAWEYFLAGPGLDIGGYAVTTFLPSENFTSLPRWLWSA